jgi:hypothetical protein
VFHASHVRVQGCNFRSFLFPACSVMTQSLIAVDDVVLFVPRHFIMTNEARTPMSNETDADGSRGRSLPALVSVVQDAASSDLCRAITASVLRRCCFSAHYLCSVCAHSLPPLCVTAQKVELRSGHSFLASYLLQVRFAVAASVARARIRSHWPSMLSGVVACFVCASACCSLDPARGGSRICRRSPSDSTHVPRSVFFDEPTLEQLRGSMILHKVADRIDSLRREYESIKRVRPTRPFPVCFAHGLVRLLVLPCTHVLTSCR